MRRRRRTFAELLARSLVASGAVYAAVLGYVVPSALVLDAPGLSMPAGPCARTSSEVADRPEWKTGDAERFRGCVDMARWTEREVPDTVVVVSRRGRLARIPFDEAFRRATSPSERDDVQTIGACG